MSEKWRLLHTENNSAYKNMAIDWAVLKANSAENVPPTVRFYTWKPSAISIGYSLFLSSMFWLNILFSMYPNLEFCKIIFAKKKNYVYKLPSSPCFLNYTICF